MLEIAAEMVWVPVPVIEKVQLIEVNCPALRSKDWVAEPLETVKPDEGVIVVETVVLLPPVLAYNSCSVVVALAASVEAGDCWALTVTNPGLLTVRVALAVCVVTLVPVAVTVIVYVPDELPVIVHDLVVLCPDESVPAVCVVESEVVSPDGSEMLTCTLETESPEAETVATSVVESPALMASSELREIERLPVANTGAISNTNARLVSQIKRI